MGVEDRACARGGAVRAAVWRVLRTQPTQQGAQAPPLCASPAAAGALTGQLPALLPFLRDQALRLDGCGAAGGSAALHEGGIVLWGEEQVLEALGGVGGVHPLHLRWTRTCLEFGQRDQVTQQARKVEGS